MPDPSAGRNRGSKPRVARADNFICGVAILPAKYLCALVFKILVNRKEMFYFAQNVWHDIGIVPYVSDPRIAHCKSNDLFVRDSLIQHLEEADRARFEYTSREGG